LAVFLGFSLAGRAFLNFLELIQQFERSISIGRRETLNQDY
jgi:hypothetical protein